MIGGADGAGDVAGDGEFGIAAAQVVGVGVDLLDGLRWRLGPAFHPQPGGLVARVMLEFDDGSMPAEPRERKPIFPVYKLYS